jgi:hypothetical protein
MMTATIHRPLTSNIVTFAAFTMASAAARAATWPLVSTIPIALLDMFFSCGLRVSLLLLFRGLIDGADNQRIDWWCLARKPCGSNGARCHHHPFAIAASQRVEGEEFR